MQNDRLVQLYPSRITLTNRREPIPFHKLNFDKNVANQLFRKQQNAESNFNVLKNPFVISKASKRKMMTSINSMYQLSEPRKVKMKNKKFIYNFRMSFITLTLPAKQNHSDIEIKKTCLNQFLVELRKHYNVKNYVWKAELQKNENIHFHLLLDQYVDFQALRRRWNRILNKLGYVDAYQERMFSMDLINYHEMRNKNGTTNFNDSAKAYAAGQKANWSNPNSVDVRSVYSKNELAAYLGKYICKSFELDNKDELSLNRQLSFGRSWFRSYSLSSLKYMNKYLESELKNLIAYLRTQKDKVHEVNNDFFTAFYFSAEQLSKQFQIFHKKFIFANAKIHGYPIPIPL